MTKLQEYGRTTFERINYLINALTEEEKRNYFRLEAFIKIYSASTGGLFDINEHTEFFSKTSMYALRQIDAVFFAKFGLHIEQHQHQIEMSEDEWKNGIKPCSHT